jgi:hypothetical protein
MKPETCVTCGATPPQADTSYTAIGHGWRVLAREAAGATIIEWHCGACWRAKRAIPGQSNPRPGSAPAPRESHRGR